MYSPKWSYLGIPLKYLTIPTHWKRSIGAQNMFAFIVSLGESWSYCWVDGQWGLWSGQLFEQYQSNRHQPCWSLEYYKSSTRTQKWYIYKLCSNKQWLREIEVVSEKLLARGSVHVIQQFLLLWCLCSR